MRKFLFSAFVLLFTPSAFAFSGNDLLHQLIQFQRINEGHGDGSLKQTADTHFAGGFVAGIFFTLGDTDSKVCLPKQGGHLGQYTAVTRQYLSKNPYELNRPAHVLVLEAAQQAFPCTTR